MSREIIAILRGVRAGEVVEIGAALLEAGIDRIEVPLNSPDPLRSVEALAAALGDRAQIGAGTVLTPEQVSAVRDAGGRLIVSPDCNPAVIDRSTELGLACWPGVATPTECFTALRCGASGLKLFPGSLIGPAGLAAIRAVLPAGAKVYAVGGAEPANFAEWLGAGANGFGIGGALYTPGADAATVGRRAGEVVAAYDAARAAQLS